jgi:imidazolonepropionase
MRALGIINDGAILVRDGRIVSVGRTEEVQRQATGSAVRLAVNGSLIMPGFVDAHTHPVFAGTREDEYELRAAGLTYQEIAAKGGGILATVRKTRKASQQELFEIGLSHVERFLRHGTTTIEAKSGYGLSTEDEIKILRVIKRLGSETPLTLIPTVLAAHEFPDEYRGSPEQRNAYIDLICDEMLPLVVAEGLAEYADVFCESKVFSLEESRRVLSRARQMGLKIRIHAEQLSLSGGARLASELGAATADHLEWVDTEGIEELRKAGVSAVLLPGAVFNLGTTRYPDARAMIEAGVPVVLATDFNPGSSPTTSMQMILSIACTQMRMTPAEAITASTINAAYSLGIGDVAGSLEVGKQADFVVFDCNDYRQIPYFFGVNHAAVVIKSGRIVFDRAGSKQMVD